MDPPEKVEDQKAREGKRKAGQGAPLGGFSRVDRKAADPGAEGIARVERRLCKGRPQKPPLFGALQHHDLFRTRDEETAPCRHDGRGNRDEGVRRAEEDGDERDEENALAHASERRIGKASGELRAEEIPRDHACAHDRHDEAHGRRRNARHFLHRGVHVAQVRKESAVSEEDRRHDEPRAKMREKAKLRAESRVGKSRHGRYETQDGKEDDHARHGRDPEDEPPGDGPGEKASERHAHEVGDRHPEHHERDVARSLARLREFARDDRAHAEVGAVREAREESGSHHHGVAVGKDRQGVPDDDEAHDDEKEVFERQVSREDGHEHYARADARGVGGDEVAGFRNGDLEIRGDGVQN